MMLIYDIDPILRHRQQCTLAIAILPFSTNGKRSRQQLQILLGPIIEDLEQLERGFRVQTLSSDFYFKAHCLTATGDTLAVADLLDHLGHLSLYPCRICVIPASRPGNASYLPPSPHPHHVRSVEEIALGFNDGLGSPSIFSKLQSFHSVYFFGLDEMHLLGQNIGRLVIKLFCQEPLGSLQTFDNPLTLPDEIWSDMKATSNSRSLV
ncbi:hypothetical protein DM01DRAFT_1107566 [Hesseltinella vesiculosa]|uniref:Uncharacterized protein n=1 Tax=Hesseltinella vesiculosa TaxID=101127 RepID=A0A1X2GB35_9FUNG|nr:hypothetical protein DM01DRAFT_1107566 [Hesseltinella vesiculosa]